MYMKKTRTRFAPSPTGYMHIGNLRTALYAFLTAKHDDGTFILRIEDTDQGRYVEGAVNVIYETLRDTKLFWDEGPDIGGPVGPYVQSDRLPIFKSYAEQLVKEDKAYYCFCSEERLNKMRENQLKDGNAVSKYDRHCRNLSQEEINKKLNAGVPYVIRQKMPLEGSTCFNDFIFGEIVVNNKELEDQVLLKSDGMPTYNFANVVDDHVMNITHVVRGNEYLSSMPKYNLLYNSFGWEPPIYIHCPPVMKDEHQKLSKRNGDASYQDLVAKGYLSEAVINYLLLLGWSPVGEKEIFTLDEMKKIWDPSRISKSPAIFDPEKLRHINFEHIKALPLETFIEKAKPWLNDIIDDVENLELLCRNLQPRTEILSEITEKVQFIKKLPEFSAELYINKKAKTTPKLALEVLEIILPILENIDVWDSNIIYNMCVETAVKHSMKNITLLYPLGIALAGTRSTPGGGTDLCIVLGKEKSIRRVKLAIENLKEYVKENYN